MANVVKSEGLVLSYEYNGGVYPMACAKGGSLSVSNDMLELAPKTNNKFKEFISNRKSWTVSGSGLVKLDATNMHSFDLFDSFITGEDINPYKQYVIKAETRTNLVDFSAIPTTVVPYAGTSTQILWENDEQNSPFLDGDLYIDVNSVNVVTATTDSSGTYNVNGWDVITAYTTFSTTWSGSGYFRLYVYNQTDGVMLFNQMVANPTAFTTVSTYTFNAEAGTGSIMLTMDIIDDANNYLAYYGECLINQLTIDSTIGDFPSYSYSLQGTGPLVKISENDTYTVSSGKITGRDTSTYKLLAIGYGGAWYYNYQVTEPSAGVFEISLGTALNGTSVKAIYKAI